MEKYTKLFESKKPSNKDMAKFILEMADSLSEFDLQKIYGEAISSKFEDEFGITAHYEGYNRFSVHSLDFNVEANSYEELKKSFEKFRGESSLSKEDEQIKISFDFINRQLTYTGNGNFIYYGIVYYSDLFYILDYAVSGKIEKSMARAIQIFDSYIDKIKELKPDVFGSDIKSLAPLTLEVKEFNVTIKAMKNGKISVKGLSKKATDRIQHVFDLIKDNR